MLGGMVSAWSLTMCLRTVSEYRKRSPQMPQCHWSRAKMYGRHSELFGSSLGSGILEPISKSPEEDNEAGELNKAQEILGVVLPADEDSALPLHPGEEALNEPTAHIAA